jgi:hypothetical protein
LFGRWRAVGFVLAVAIGIAARDANAADRQVRPFVAFTFAGDTTFSPDLGEAAGKVHGTIGVDAAVLGEVFGAEFDLAHTPGFFQTGDANDLILSSSVTTLTGNVVIGLPRKWMEYTLRPYVVVGGGIMRIRALDYFAVVDTAETRPAMDLGAGAVGFLRHDLGVAWEVRRFQTLGTPDLTGTSFGAKSVSFWRASMALAIRF